MEQITLLARLNHIEKAIKRIKEFEPKEGYYLAFSGGKDSQAVKLLMDLADVKYEAKYNVTSCDPPELIYFLKSDYQDVKFEYPGTTMWELIAKKMIVPTRLMRFCCEYLKESNGTDRFVVTGVRWSESNRRKNTRSAFEIYHKNKKYRKKTYDNDSARRMFENCIKRSKYILNPIIDWEEYQVWEFLKKYKINYCKLYDKGFSRLGCIGCPLSGCKQQKFEFEMYPNFRKLYIQAFEKMISNRNNKGLETKWKTGEDVMT